MRKLTLVFAAMLCIFASCQKIGPMGPMGPAGPAGPQGADGKGAKFTSVIVDVPADAWTLLKGDDDDMNRYYCATISTLKELTQDAFDFGAISVYRLYDWEGKNPSQVVLPFVNFVEGYDGEGYFKYSESVYYEYGVGWMNIYYGQDDFFYEIDPTVKPVAMKFRVLINYPE